MLHIFRNIFFAVIALSITYSSCFAMEESDKLLRRNVSSVNDLSEKENLHSKMKNTNENIPAAPVCCCLHIALDYVLYVLDFNLDKNEA